MSMVTQPLASSAATSALPATSCMVLKPCVMLPTLQLPWSAGRVANVRSAAFTQNTHPAATFPVRPSGVGPGIVPSYTGIPAGTASRNVIAIGAMSKLNSSCSSAANPFQSCAICASPSLSIVDSLTLRPAKLAGLLRPAIGPASLAGVLHLACRRLLLSPDVPHGFVLGWELCRVVHKGWYRIADAIFMRTLQSLHNRLEL